MQEYQGIRISFSLLKLPGIYLLYQSSEIQYFLSSYVLQSFPFRRSGLLFINGYVRRMQVEIGYAGNLTERSTRQVTRAKYHLIRSQLLSFVYRLLTTLMRQP